MSDQACDIGEAERDPSKDPITILKSICFVETGDPLVCIISKSLSANKKSRLIYLDLLLMYPVTPSG